MVAPENGVPCRIQTCVVPLKTGHPRSLDERDLIFRQLSHDMPRSEPGIASYTDLLLS
jgi:hypothetical protein